MTDENGYLVTGFHSILARWRKYFSQLLNVHCVNDDRHTKIHTGEPLVPEPSVFDFHLAIEKLKSHKSLESNEIPAEQFTLRYINLRFLFGIRRNFLRNGRSQSLYLSTRRSIKQSVVIIDSYHFCQLCAKFHPTFCS